ncbi:hypothetical protein HDU85_003719 [Gaertneriomyces sp. JEL0708]|nr:hypothetical protein HDU85_003719 [Gaertneriomyces sp. JEL0708]
MARRKLINDPDEVVIEALRGLVATNPGLKLLDRHKVVYRASRTPNEVALLSGGGAGHEPSHTGFIGDGMLTGAVCGNVFASPSSSQVYAGIKQVDNGAGVLVIVKNYTGDKVHFGKAVEKAKRDGIDVRMVVVGEDCAIDKNKLGRAGRRGLSGVLFVHKIAGAAAKSGASLAEVYRRAQEAAELIGTVGVALTPCTLPGHQEAAFSIGNDEMELGLGIHGEAGAYRTELLSSQQTAATCLDLILSEDSARNYLQVQPGERVALMVNDLGGLTGLELNILVQDAIRHLSTLPDGSKNLTVVRVISGRLMTSLEMAGASFTILKLGQHEGILQALDTPVKCVAWPGVVGSHDDTAGQLRSDAVFTEEPSRKKPKYTVSTPHGQQFLRVIHSICKALSVAVPDLNKYDAASGDGDCGNSIKSGITGILFTGIMRETYDSAWINADDAADAIAQLSEIIEEGMGGSLGGLICLFLESLSTSLQASDFPTSLEYAMERLVAYTGTSVGDRTLVDALSPAVDAFVAAAKCGKPVHECVHSASVAAKTGMNVTVNMATAKAGRSANVGQSLKGVPDPGAFAVHIVWEAVDQVLQGAK